MADNVYDAIVIGSGISGGWAAKELAEGIKNHHAGAGKERRARKGLYERNQRPLGFSA